MASWLCCVSSGELRKVPAWTDEARRLGIAAWIVPLAWAEDGLDCLADVTSLLEDRDGLPLVPALSDCSGLSQRGCTVLTDLLHHDQWWRWRGRPCLFIKGVGDNISQFEAIRSETRAWLVAEIRGPGVDGVVERVPLPPSKRKFEDRKNFEVHLQFAHWRGAPSDGWRIPAVRGLTTLEMGQFTNATAEKYQNWLTLASLWTELQFDGDPTAPVLLESWSGHQKWWSKQSQTSVPLSKTPQLPPQQLRWGHPKASHTALLVHGFYLDGLAEMLDRFQPDEEPGFDLYVSTPLQQMHVVVEMLKRQGWQRVCVFGVTNRGRDIAPFLLHLLPAALAAGHFSFVKLHTKSSPHLSDGETWGEVLTTTLLQSEFLKDLPSRLESLPKLALLGAAGTRVPMTLQLQNNGFWLKALMRRTGTSGQQVLSAPFIAGSMFAGRLSGLRPLMDLGLRLEDFEPEAGQTDGTLAHAIERWIGVVIHQQRLVVNELEGDHTSVPDFGHRWAQHQVATPAEQPLYEIDDVRFTKKLGDFEVYSLQAKELKEQGYTVVDLGRERMAAMARRIQQDLAECFDLEAWRLAGGGTDLRVQDAWLRSAAVRELALLPELKQLLMSCWGRPPFAFQTLNFPVGTQQHLHSDAVHFHSEPAGFMCGIWVALEDIHPDAGPLKYLPGSHRLPYLHAHDVGVKQAPGVTPDQRIFHDHWSSLEWRHGFVPQLFTPKLGQALIWTANLIHGGAKVRDPQRSRWSQVTHYFFEGCRYYTPMLSDWPDGSVAWRQPLDIAREESLVGVEP